MSLSQRCVVINLETRPDRWTKFEQEAKIENFLNYEKYCGINGNNIKSSHQLYRLFDGNDYNMRAGIVGCALSHIKLYIELINSNFDYYCILEDDIQFVPDFNNKLEHVKCQLNKNKDWDLIYLGHFCKKQYITNLTYNKKSYPKIEKYNMQESFSKSMGGTIGYLISKKGANKLLDFINKYGMTNAIDTMQQKSADILNIFYCSTHLVYSKCHMDEEKIDN